MNQKNGSEINLLARTLLMLSILLSSASVDAVDEYQYSVLFSPSPSMLMAEAKGRVMIYDGLENKTVDLAMDEQFQRIENMMFVRTQYIQEDGDIEVEEDGCD